MNSGKSLVDLAKELQRQQESKKDFVAPTTKLEVLAPQVSPEDAKFDRPLRLRVGESGEFGINRTAHGQLADHVGIPQKYYDRMRDDSPQLLAENVNHWLHKKPVPRLVRVLDSNVRAFLSSRYRMIDNFDLASAALPVLQSNGAAVVSTEVTESHLYLKAVVAQRNRIELVRGDWLEFGISISNSEIGQGSVKIEPFINRLICTNGMIAPDKGINKYHVGRQSAELETAYEVFRDQTREADDRAFFLKVIDVVRAGLDQQQARFLADRLKESTAVVIDAAPDKVVEQVTKRYSLTDGDQGNILRALIEGGDRFTQWGLANAITRVANTEKDYEKATAFERMGGEVAFLPQPDFRELIAV